MSSAQNAKQQDVFAMRGEKVVSLHEVRSFWILKLDNLVLRSLIENNATHLRPTDVQIDEINRACITPVSHQQYNESLKTSGIFLAPNQVKWANTENRQIQYRNRIENRKLRELAKGFHIRASKWNQSAEKQIDFINALLHHPITSEKLDLALVSIHIIANNEELNAVIEEAAAYIEASPHLSAQKDCKALQQAIELLNTQAVNRQFTGYLTLIINESALSAHSVDALKTEIRLVSENPYVAAVKSIRKQGEKLHQRRNVLLQQRSTPKREILLQQIDKTLKRLETASYPCLMRQQFALEKWANTNTMSDMLHREISALAPKRVLRSDQANRLFEKLHRRSIKATS